MHYHEICDNDNVHCPTVPVAKKNIHLPVTLLVINLRVSVRKEYF